jgi:hypothetical protein
MAVAAIAAVQNSLGINRGLIVHIVAKKGRDHYPLDPPKHLQGIASAPKARFPARVRRLDATATALAAANLIPV